MLVDIAYKWVYSITNLLITSDTKGISMTKTVQDFINSVPHNLICWEIQAGTFAEKINDDMYSADLQEDIKHEAMYCLDMLYKIKNKIIVVKEIAIEECPFDIELIRSINIFHNWIHEVILQCQEVIQTKSWYADVTKALEGDE